MLLSTTRLNFNSMIPSTSSPTESNEVTPKTRDTHKAKKKSMNDIHDHSIVSVASSKDILTYTDRLIKEDGMRCSCGRILSSSIVITVLHVDSSNSSTIQNNQVHLSAIWGVLVPKEASIFLCNYDKPLWDWYPFFLSRKRSPWLLNSTIHFHIRIIRSERSRGSIIVH